MNKTELQTLLEQLHTIKYGAGLLVDTSANGGENPVINSADLEGFMSQVYLLLEKVVPVLEQQQLSQSPHIPQVKSTEYSTFTQTTANNVSYQIKVPKHIATQCLRADGNILDIIAEHGEIV